MKPLVATVAVLVALATGAPVQAQTPELDELRALAEQGDATAQFNLGVMYGTGRGVPQDDAEAVVWIRRAAEQGDATAQVTLEGMERRAERTTQPGGSPPEPTEINQLTAPSSPLSSGVEIEISVELTENNKARVHGATNLPDGTSLLVSLINEATRATRQDKTSVRNGRFQFALLGPLVGLPVGRYIVRVTMPVALVQPESVKAIIGPEGENLRGPTVKTMGHLGNVVVVETIFLIGAQENIAQAASDFRNELEAVRLALTRLLAEGRAMQPLRNNRDLAVLQKCGEAMRRLQERAAEIQIRADRLPAQHSLLAAAAISLTPCVSCLPDAIESCDLAEELIDDDGP